MQNENQNNQQPVQPSVSIPENSVQPVPIPVPAAPPKSKSKAVIILFLLVVLVIAISVVVGYIVAKRVGPGPVVNVTPTPTQTRQINPNKHPIATDSAYLEFKLKHATLDNSIRAYDSYDPTLSQPALDLPLGFANN